MKDHRSSCPSKAVHGGSEEKGEMGAGGRGGGAKEVEEEGKKVEADEAEGVDDAEGGPL